MRNIFAVFLICLFCQVNGLCPRLPLPVNTVEKSIDNSSVTYTCQPLYELTSGDLQRNCTGWVWSGHPPVCSAINCTNLNINNTIPGPTTAQHGESVTVSCETGYAVSVSHLSNPPTIIRTQTIRCLGNATLKIVFWEETKNCSAITCEEPDKNTNSFNDDTGNREYNSTIRHSCESGYSSSKSVNFEVTCSSNGTWEGFVMCIMRQTYIGCFGISVMNSNLSHTVSDAAGCIEKCKTLDNRYAAVTGDQCYCENDINLNVPLLLNSFCNTTCNVQDDQVYCGGPNNQVSLYNTIISGCYKTLKEPLVNLHPFKVTGVGESTCHENCRAKDAYFSIYAYPDQKCACTNLTSIIQQRTGKTCDEDEKDTDVMYNVTNIATDKVKYDSCETLYKSGVRWSDYYYINNIKVFCYLKDGTVCEDGWLGYKGSCYYFHVANMTFAQSTSYCTSLNATIASLLTAEENSFANEAISVFPDLKTNGGKWYIGLYDHKSVSAFSWVDGNILTKQHFAESEPSDESRQCVVLYNGYWYSYDCTNSTNVICKHNNESLYCIETESIIESTWNSTKADMSLTVCVQACMARGYKYAVNRGNDCHCVDRLPPHEHLSFDKCSQACPGNSYQSCGGLQNETYTVSKVDNANKASNCEELQSQGLQGDIYFLQNSVNATLCEDTGCPYSWIKRNSSCYKFMVGQRKQQDAVAYCANYSSYLVVFEDEIEETFIQNAAKNIGIYSGIQKWKFGLFSCTYYSHLYRWANGYSGSDLIRTVHPDNQKKVGLLEGSTWKLKTAQEASSFICEKSPEYLGCYRYVFNGSTLAANLTDSVLDMTVEKCLEMCRGLGYNIAMIMEQCCMCNYSVDSMQPYPTGCSENPCSLTQPCGSTSNGAVSVYNNIHYPKYNSCLSLFERGVTVNGLYQLSNGTAWCNFADNSSCPDGWISYEKKCYMPKAGSESYNAMRDTCRKFGSTPAAMYNANQHNFLKKAVIAEKHYTRTKIWIGQNDEFLIGVPTWSTGTVSSYYPVMPTNQKLGRVMQLSPTSLYSVTLESEEADAVICQIDFADKGCFLKPMLLTPTLESNSMELTQCKQICLGRSNGTGYVMMQGSSCFCANETHLFTTVDSSLCTLNCPGNRLQRCGGGFDYVNVYSYDASDMATSCSILNEHRVWYNSTYLINENDTAVRKQCGIFDGTTLCTTGWYDKENYCFRIQPAALKYNEASTKCFIENGYLAYFSRTSSCKQDILKFLTQVTHFTLSSHWWMSVMDVFMNGMYLEGDGHVVSSTDWERNTTITDEMYFTVQSHDGSWDSTKNAPFPFICEKGPGYVGCKTNFTTAAPFTTISNISWMTATQCIQYCLGQSSMYAAVTMLQTCLCLQETNFSSGYESDCESCPGYKSQPCGSNGGHYSVFNLEFYLSETLQDCDTLERIGVIQPGTYVIKSSAEKVQCFQRPPLVGIIPVTYSASSEDGIYKASQAAIRWPFSPNDVWKPLATDSSAWLQLTMSDEYVVLGISTQGRPSHEHNQWMRSYKVLFTSVMTLQWVDSGYLMDGNSNRTLLATVFISKPFVSNKVRIYPQSISQLALRVRIYGQLLANFSHNDSTLGCYLHDDSMFEYWSSTPADNDCLSTCYSGNRPFYAFQNPNCYCIKNPDTLARVEDCSLSTSRTVKRTFDMFCVAPQPAAYSTNTSYYAHTNGIYTIKTTIHYNCYQGYEFPDETTSAQITCIDGNVWSPNISNCQIINCPALSPPDHAVIDKSDTEFGAVVTAICDVGYTLVDNSTEQVAQCQSNKTWNITMQNCQVTSCGTPPDVPNTKKTGNDYTFNNTITYTCNDAMWFSNETFTKSILCHLNGSWDDVTGNCTYTKRSKPRWETDVEDSVVSSLDYMCPEPPSVQKAIVQRISATSAIYKCQKFFSFTDGSTQKPVICNADTKLWESISRCQINESEIQSKTGHFTDYGKYLLTDVQGTMVNPFAKKTAVSFMDCAGHCVSETYCLGFNYFSAENSLTVNCKLYDIELGVNNVLTADSKWNYFNADLLDYY